MYSVVVEELNVWYGKQHALKNVSVSFPPRQITAIIGPSGCGKSTLLKALNRLLELNEDVRINGRVLLDDEDIYAPNVDVTEVRTRIGLLAQKPIPLPLSIYDNVAYGPRLHGLVQRNADVSPWFPMLLLIYPVWETIFSIYRKAVRGVSPGVADALHFHQLIYRRIVRGVFHDDESRRVLMRNNRTSPYLWGFTLLTVVPAVLFWGNSPMLMAFCALFVISYVMGYFAIVRFKVPSWLRH